MKYCRKGFVKALGGMPRTRGLQSSFTISRDGIRSTCAGDQVNLASENLLARFGELPPALPSTTARVEKVPRLGTINTPRDQYSFCFVAAAALDADLVIMPDGFRDGVAAVIGSRYPRMS